MTAKEWLRSKMDSRKTPYPYGTKRQMAVGGLVAVGIPFSGILLAYFNGGYSEPGEWVYVFITPWHLITLVGLYYLVMAYVIKEKGKRK